MSRQEKDKYIIRMPDGMRDALKHAASENHRSLNSEIVYRLEKSLNPNNVATGTLTALLGAKSIVRTMEGYE